MSIKDQIKALTGPSDYTLTEDEYWAVHDWINAEKDALPAPLKDGLLKLLNGESHRRL